MRGAGDTRGGGTAELAKPRVYARRATGLVREVSPFSTFVFNMAAQPTAILLAVSVFFTLGLYPGGSLWLAFALALGLALALCLCYGLFTSAIPRSGGDYVLVSRVIHPVVGLISSFFWIAGVILVIAFVAQAFVVVALGPSLTAVGLVSGQEGLVSAGEEVAAGRGWQFGIGAAVIIGSAALLAGGWRWTTRIMNGLWALTMLGLGTVFLVLVFKSHGGFVDSFNHFSAPLTGGPDAYDRLIAAARREGVSTNPPFSLDHTWPMMAAIAGLSIYGWLSIYISGEVRRARDTAQVKIMSLASIAHVGIAVAFAALFFSRFGHDFFYAINAIGQSKAYPFAAPPYYTFLASIAGGSTVLAWWLFVSFAVAYPLLMLPNITVAVRTFFAWGLDGLLPAPFARVSGRTHAPNYAIALTVALGLAALWWAVSNNEGFLEFLYEAVLLQLVTMILLSLAAVLLPYRRPEAWRSSASTLRLAGIPLVSLAGALSIVLMTGLFFVYMRYPDLGIEKGHFFRDCGAIAAAALVAHFGARLARRRQGVDVDKLASEIPPE